MKQPSILSKAFALFPVNDFYNDLWQMSWIINQVPTSLHHSLW